jgi:hypothetical protein
MPVVPKSFLTIGAGFLSARAARRLRREGDAVAAQESAFGRLTPRLARAEVWKGAGIESGMDYESFRSKINLRSHSAVAPHIERMKQGEPDVLWPGKCQIYCVSAGTTNGTPKYLPVTEAMLDHFKRCGLESALWYMARVGSTRVLRGRHLFTGGSTALSLIPDSEHFEAYSGELSGISALNMPRWMEKHLYEPGAEIAQMTDWTEKVAAMAERTATLDITLLAGIPNWALVIAEALRDAASRAGEPVENLQALWPNLECFTHGGVPIAPFQEELRSLLGPTVNFHEVYRAAECFVASQDAEPSDGLRLMADSGVFFEFLPMSRFDERRLAELGAQAVPLSDVKVGVDYALVITTPSGLARYANGDVVRFVSTEPARLTYVGRTRLRLNAFRENVSEEEITAALLAVCSRNRWTIVNFHVAPIITDRAMGSLRGRHEWWVELKPGTDMTPTGPIIAAELDAELLQRNAEYDARRHSGILEAPFVRLVMPGVFEHWMRYHGRWGGQNKMPRCQDDRIIADELGTALQFAKD